MKRDNVRPMNAKRLEFRRETLRRLHDDWLRQVQGKAHLTQAPPSHDGTCPS